jgi:hypothetical protein
MELFRIGEIPGSDHGTDHANGCRAYRTSGYKVSLGKRILFLFLIHCDYMTLVGNASYVRRLGFLLERFLLLYWMILRHYPSPNLLLF